MQLRKVQVQEFQSVTNSNEFDIDRVTCLVGKNESGKTALLQALYRLKPMVESEGSFNVVFDYPKRGVTQYERAVAIGERQPALVTTAAFELDSDELAAIAERFGPKALTSPDLTLLKGYENSLKFILPVNVEAAAAHVISQADVTEDQRSELRTARSPSEALAVAQRMGDTPGIERLRTLLSTISNDFNVHLFHEFLSDRVPTFLYFSEYYQLSGAVNLPALVQRKQSKTLNESDYPLLGLLSLAGVDVQQFLAPESTQKLKNELRGASNYVHDKVMKYWSQNKHLRLDIDVRQGLPQDPEGLRSGNNIWAEVFDERHRASTQLGSRSKGFVWFFSFIAWYETLRHSNLVLLLDEPGLSLHGRAQADLLNYIDNELAPKHQVIYSTHSPFMIDPRRFEQVRIVQDKGMDIAERLPPEEDGTKVLQGFLDANDDSLFPFHGAAGFDVFQTLFLGPNSLVVEGKSDFLCFQLMTEILQAQGRSGLSALWTVTPTGGDGRVFSVASILAAQRGLNVALLLDKRKTDQRLDNFLKDRVVPADHVMTYGDILNASEADIEDLFPPDFYIELVNGAYSGALRAPIELSDLNEKIPRIVARLDAYLTEHPLREGTFSHYRPIRYFADHIADYSATISAETLDRFESLFKHLNGML